MLTLAFVGPALGINGRSGLSLIPVAFLTNGGAEPSLNLAGMASGFFLIFLSEGPALLAGFPS